MLNYLEELYLDMLYYRYPNAIERVFGELERPEGSSPAFPELQPSALPPSYAIGYKSLPQQ